MITGSSIRRVMKCPSSVHLAQVKSETPATRLGTEVHVFLEKRQRGESTDLGTLRMELRQLIERIDMDKLPPPGTLGPEVAYALNVKTGSARSLPGGREAGYPSVDWAVEIPCTLDLAGVDRANHRGYVGDYKVGFGPDELAPPAATNEQTLFGAVCLQRAHGLDSVRTEIIKINEDGEVYPDAHEHDVFSLDVFAERLRLMWERVQEAKTAEPAVYTMGEHCKWCPARRLCPAQVGLLQAFVGEIGDGTKKPELLITAENARLVVQRILAVERVAEMARAQLNALSDEAPIDIGGGEMFGPRPMRRLLAEKTRSVVAMEFGDEVAKDAIEMKSSTSAEMVKRALQAHGKLPARGASKAMDDLLERLEQAGAVRQSITHKVYKARKEAE